MSKSDWVRGSEVCEKLSFSEDHLARLRTEGFLKENKHWRNIGRPMAARPTYRYHLKLIEKALEIPAELRG